MCKRILRIKEDWAFHSFNSLFLLSVIFLTLYPFLYLIAISLSGYQAVLENRVSFFPIDFTLKAYENVLQNEQILIAYKNSIIYAGIGTFFNLVVVTMAAYPLSKKDLKFRKQISFFFIFTALFSGGMIPTYLVIKNLNMIDTIWALVLPGAFTVWHTIILRTFFGQIPVELEEAARIDGMGKLGILMKIFIPLSIPIYAALILFFAVNHWNSFFAPMIYLNKKNMYPLQVILRDIVISGSVEDMMTYSDSDVVLSESTKAATIMVVVLPILVLYPFVQKYFVKGMMIGAVKG